ncbi:MAG TPA: sialidase family protein [Pyrinomonadaceae bacterium]|nr:sialidase family protein [Pyrinomonadaceae bacterium]
MPDGTAVFSVLEITANDEQQLLIYRSKDGGLSWTDKPVNLGAGHDHQTLVVDTTDKQFAGSLYVASGRPIQNKAGKSRSAVYVARSTDGGVSFQKPEHIISSNLSYGAQSSVILSDGTLLVNFADFQRKGDGRLESPREWLTASADGGKTFSESLFISETCDARVGWSSLAVDTSNGKLRDRVYHLCGRKQFVGLQIRYSDNQGEKWSGAVRIDREGNATPYIKNPTMAINKDGIVGVAWSDARNDPGEAKSIFLVRKSISQFR